MAYFKPNRDFFKILDEFNEQLPPQQKRAKENTEILEHFTVIETGSMKMNIKTSDIDIFQKKLERFKYNRILFKRKGIESYSNNLQRLLKTSAWEKFGVALVQKLLEEDIGSRPYLFSKRIGRYLGF